MREEGETVANTSRQSVVPCRDFQMVCAYLFAMYISAVPLIKLWINEDVKDREAMFVVEGFNAVCLLGLAHGFITKHFKEAIVEEAVVGGASESGGKGGWFRRIRRKRR
jgi:hypothetical protein